jgi:REP element-mobilizing transposase RayT
MAHTFTQLIYHCVFATKGRLNIITPPLAAKLHAYIAAIIRNEIGFVRAIGGTANHIHILADITASISVADAVRDIKSRSSGWVRSDIGNRSFGWQEGYGAFSVSASAVDAVKAYIDNQEEHHATRTFEEEFRLLLEKHGIAYEK